MQLSDSLDKGFNAGVNKHIYSLTVLIVEMLSKRMSACCPICTQEPDSVHSTFQS
jgi:hypothetical protein